MQVLSTRTLNRALLARNLLLQRDGRGAVEAVEHLVAIQAQEPLEPYVALWSRLDGFGPEHLAGPLRAKQLVRTLMMRRTMHLLTAPDALALRAHHDPMLRQRGAGVLKARLVGVDLDELRDAGRAELDRRPFILPAVGRLVSGRWPDAQARDLGDMLGSLVALVQVTPRGVWGEAQLPALNTTMRAWLGRDPDEAVDDVLDAMVLRYLRAFGPAASADVRAWCGLAGLPAVVQRLRDRLRTFRDERGRLLLDVQDGVLPEADVPAPVRFLPAFDNAVLAYDDRSRVIADEHRGLSVEGARFVLVDGRVAATWTDVAGAVTVSPLVPLDRSARRDVVAEGEGLSVFLGGSGSVAWAR